MHKVFATNVIKPIIRGYSTDSTSVLGAFFVYYLRLNTMNNIPKYNSPSRDLSSSNASPMHCIGSCPIGGFLLGE